MRKRTGWFEFKGELSTGYKAYLMDEMRYIRGAERGKSLIASGRDGDLWIADNSRAAVDIKRRIWVPRSKLNAASAWLTGSGLLRFSQEPGCAWEARADRETEYKQVTLGGDPWYEGTVTWICQPYRLLYPAASPIQITASGQSLTMQGTAKALPRVEIIGSGNFMVTIGRQAMFFDGISGGVIVDSQLMDALTLDGGGLMNAHVSGDFFQLDPAYPTTVTWVLESGATIQKIAITPRWRFV